MKQVLITGATGFIGGRLAEVAIERAIPVVGLVRAWPRVARLARLPVRMVHGDILDLDSLREAKKGCDVVFHCVVDNRVGGRAHRRTSVEGTANVMQVALETGIKRVVQLSSIAVYSYRPGPDAATEEGIYRYSGDAYCDGKIDAEKVALRYYREHGLPVTVLRPTVVYGPFGYYTVHTATLIRKGPMVLVDGGTGVCNSLYVDNLVETMLLAAEHDSAAGEVFHISDASPVTWKEFIEAHARAVGNSYLPLPEMTVQEIAAARPQRGGIITSSLKQALRLMRDPRTHQALGSIPVVKRSVQMGMSIAKTLLPAPARRLLRQTLLREKIDGNPDSRAQQESSHLPSQAELDVYTANVVFSVEKARRLLGYDPSIDFAEGMERTTAWIKWARL